MKILIVDDKAENLYLLQALLTGHGFSVTSAYEGREALALARKDPPDLIVSAAFPAAQFVVRHRAALFPGAPLLLMAIDERAVPRAAR